MKPAKFYSPKHLQTQKNSKKKVKAGLKQSKRVAEWRQNGLQQNQQGGSNFF